jgi:hypothetical protein
VAAIDYARNGMAEKESLSSSILFARKTTAK